ncbi:S8 family serine peptidase, partial [Streptococcus pneumoniae]|uniref:S8 family serine peptidase n=1 Tax=Streptococcus pneumoniae TaxID=1313 RepID=UPI0019D6CC1E
ARLPRGQGGPQAGSGRVREVHGRPEGLRGGRGRGAGRHPHRHEGDWYAAGECGTAGASDSSWHGTHVAGTVAAVADSQGVVGVAPNAKIQPIRVLGKCGGSLSDIADAVVWAAGGTVAG